MPAQCSQHCYDRAVTADDRRRSRSFHAGYGLCWLGATSGLMHRSECVLFNDLVGKLLDVQGYIKAENLRDLKIDDYLEFRRKLHR